MCPPTDQVGQAVLCPCHLGITAMDMDRAAGGCVTAGSLVASECPGCGVWAVTERRPQARWPWAQARTHHRRYRELSLP